MAEVAGASVETIRWRRMATEVGHKFEDKMAQETDRNRDGIKDIIVENFHEQHNLKAENLVKR